MRNFSTMQQYSHSTHTEKLLRLLEESLRQNPPVAPTELFYDSQTKSIIKELEKLKGEISLLDYGCGNLRLLKGLKTTSKAQNIKYLATDIKRPHVTEFDKHDYEYYDITVLREKFPSNFDVIVLMNVIHEISIQSIATIFEDIRRLLKTNGFFILMDMSVLPEGEPLALPFYSWEFNFLFDKFEDLSYTSKSGLPIVFLKIPKSSIPTFGKSIELLKGMFEAKRNSYSELACQLHNPQKRDEYEWLIKKLSLSGNNLYDLSLLMMLSGHANFRLIEELTRKAATTDEVIEAAIKILEYFFDTFHATREIITINDIFQKLGSYYSYDQLRFAIKQMSSTFGGFFFPIRADNEPLQPTESVDAFADYYTYDDIREMGLYMIQQECHNKMWP